MKIIINAYSAEYILKHGVRPEEVHEIAADPGRVDSRLKRIRSVMFGITVDGWYLKVILKKTKKGLELRSAWDMEESEIETYKRNRKIRRQNGEEKETP